MSVYVVHLCIAVEADSADDAWSLVEEMTNDLPAEVWVEAAVPDREESK